MLRRDSARICPRDRCQVSKPLYNPNPDDKKKKTSRKNYKHIETANTSFQYL
jgi:hypothetical protein